MTSQEWDAEFARLLAESKTLFSSAPSTTKPAATTKPTPETDTPRPPEPPQKPVLKALNVLTAQLSWDEPEEELQPVSASVSTAGVVPFLPSLEHPVVSTTYPSNPNPISPYWEGSEDEQQ